MENKLDREEAVHQVEAVAAILRKYATSPDMQGTEDEEAMNLLARSLREAVKALKEEQ